MTETEYGEQTNPQTEQEHQPTHREKLASLSSQLLDCYNEDDERVFKSIDEYYQNLSLQDEDEKEVFLTNMEYLLGERETKPDVYSQYIDTLPQGIVSYLNENKDKFNQIRNLRTEINQLEQLEIAEVYENYKKEMDDMSDKFDWSKILTEDSDSNTLLAAIYFLEEFTTYQSIRNSMEEGSTEIRLGMMDYLQEKVKRTREQVEHEDLLMNESTQIPEFTDREYEDALIVFKEIENENLIEKMRQIEEYHSIMRTGEEGYKEYYATEFTSRRRKDDNKVPLGISGGKLATVLIAKKIQQERQALLVDSYFPADVDGDQIEQARELVMNYANELAEWVKLGEKYRKFNNSKRLDRNIPFVTLGYINNRNGKLPDVVEDNPMMLIQLSKQLEEERDKLVRAGILHRVNRWDVPEDEREPNKDFEGRISGLEPKEDLLLVMTEEQLRLHIRAALPSSFHEKVSDINIVAGNNDGYLQNNEYREVEAYIARGMSEYYRAEILGTIYHEFFEDIIFSLSIDELEAWDEALQADRNNEGSANYISNYARKCSLDNEDLGDKEDFCDSGSMFIMSPADLQAIAPQRFNYMLELVSSRMPKDQAERYKKSIQTTIYLQNNPSENTAIEFKQKQIEILIAHDQLPIDEYKIRQKTAEWKTLGTKSSQRTETSGNQSEQDIEIITIYDTPYIKPI